MQYLLFEIKRLILLFCNDVSWLSIDQRLFFDTNPRKKIIIPNELENWKIIKPFTTFTLFSKIKYVTDIKLRRENLNYVIRYEIKSKRHYVIMQSRSKTKKLNKIIKYSISK